VNADRQIEITVQDTGMGIAAEHLARVFDRFWQADSARTSQTGNCGLGLAIAQAIAQSHGGVITVSSQVGQGTCFTVQLPLATLTE
jgi:two-component system, OmpR family, manganese sensing sensor histidine kinase